MKRRKVIITTLALAFLAVGLSINSKKYLAYQGCNNLFACKAVYTIRFGGIEMYSKGAFAVYESELIPRLDNLPPPVTQVTNQRRLLGHLISGTDPYNLGYEHYDQEACIEYLRGLEQARPGITPPN